MTRSAPGQAFATLSVPRSKRPVGKHLAAVSGFCLVAALTTLSLTVMAYPLDGYDYTGIRRLDFYQRAQLGEVQGRRLPSGGLLAMAQVTPRLPSAPPLPLPEPDIAKSRQLADLLADLLGNNADRYSVALLDLSDPDRPIYAVHNPNVVANVGSVGKLLVALSLFQKLAVLYPDDLAARERVLRSTQVVADRFIIPDHHKVPLWDMDSGRLQHRALQLGDKGTLWEFIDWMMSASSNAAAAMVMKELMLINYFGHDYPVSREAAEDFFSSHSKRELGEQLQRVMLMPIQNNGLDPKHLRQGSFFTREGKRRVDGSQSFATPQQLLTLLYRLERGQLVDAFSSREMKRLLYMTQKRIRYASHPGMHGDAIYFKSGSLYRCRPEPGFVCGKYQGNVENRLASVAIVESPSERPRHHYLVTVLSNVLRKNSAVAHQTLAIRIHRLVQSWHRQTERSAPKGAS
tara:strand:- start:507 stop:1886 length:1380 start_codon:yes stop_codon:yes gene_type:complete